MTERPSHPTGHEDPYCGTWTYTPEVEAKIDQRWIHGDPYGDDCAETNIRSERIHVILDGLCAARRDVRTLLLEIRRLRARLKEAGHG